MSKKRSTKSENAPLRFDERLVLNQWMLRLFELGNCNRLVPRGLELRGTAV